MFLLRAFCNLGKFHYCYANHKFLSVFLTCI